MKKLFYTLLLAAAVVSLSISPVLAGGEGCGGGKCDKSKNQEKVEGDKNLSSCGGCEKSNKEKTEECEKKKEGENKEQCEKKAEGEKKS